MKLTSADKKRYSQFIKKAAEETGFDFCGIAPAGELTSEKLYYNKWLSFGYHGKMRYLEKNSSLRFNPALFFDNAKSVISLAINYYPGIKQNQDSCYKISKYAYGKDYHIVIKNKLSILLDHIRSQIGEINGRGFVDSAPVLEKTWAQKAGLGWTGKNGCLIIPKHGSYFFLCELIIDLELKYDEPFNANYCGTCKNCIESCPTGAINENGLVNASKCISYLTIELKDKIENTDDPPQYKNWIFGCDTCQDVCPWNRFANPCDKNTFQLNENILDLTGKQWENFTKEQYRSLIKKTGSPIARIKFDKLKNNIEYVKD